MKMDLTGRTFGNWTVICDLGRKRGKRRWKCACVCGRIVSVSQYSLTAKLSESCGCQRRISSPSKLSNVQKHPLYHTWTNMRDRCNNPRNSKYHVYGGRGVSVCSRWDSFEYFCSDVGPKPSPNHTLDRINGDLGYTPSNCRWATIAEQNRNLRTCRPVVRSDGVKFGSIAEAAESVGVSEATIRSAMKWKRMTAGYSWAAAN